MAKSIPKIFISYSHDSTEHKQWVLDLATRLVHSGIDTTLDAWSLNLGDDIPHFMETQLMESDRVIMICSEKYVIKANKGSGGVGYEKMIVTASMMQSIDDNKVIPIIRQNGTCETPIFLKTKLYLDFSNDNEFESVIDDLIREIHGVPLFKKPNLGNNPYLTAKEKPAEMGNDLKKEILTLAISLYETGRDHVSDAFYYKSLKISRIVFEIMANELHKEGFIQYFSGHITLTDKAKSFAINQGWLG